MKQKSKFKETEIGLIPDDWEVMRIEEIGEVIGGGTPSTKNDSYYGGNIAWITPRDLSNHNEVYISKGERCITEEGLKNSSAKLMPKGTVLFTSRAPIGYVAIAKNEVCTNQGFKSIICNNKTNNKFIYYWLKQNKDMIESLASGSTFKEVSGSVLKSIKIALPPLPEQRAIAKILSDLDLKIELLQKQNETLEKIGQAIFKHWFVDFEFPNEEGKPYKSSGGEMKESELGKIPEGWEVKRLSEVTSLIRDGTHNPPKRIAKGIPLLTGVIFGNGFLNHSKITYISEEEYKKIHKKYQPKNNDIVLTKIGTIGKVAILRNIDLPLAIHCNSALLRANSFISPAFLYYLFTSQFMQNQIQTNKQQTVQEFMNLKQISDLLLILPKGGAKTEFDNFSELLINKRSLVDFQIQSLQKTRDLLLPKLMTGKIRVPLEIRN